MAVDEAFVRALHERTDGMPLFVASVMSDMRSRTAEGGAGAAEHVAKMAVPENLAAIIEHYVAALDNDQRAVLSAAAAYGVEFRVKTIAAALERGCCVRERRVRQARARAAMASRPGRRQTRR
jgi:predicted ATPase